MSKVAVIYWSGTGNTAAITLFTSGEFNASMISGFDAIVFGCPVNDCYGTPGWQRKHKG